MILIFLESVFHIMLLICIPKLRTSTGKNVVCRSEVILIFITEVKFDLYKTENNLA